jgi:hypothetical protein
MKNTNAITVSTSFINSFIASYEAAFDAMINLSQTLCDAWHRGELTSVNLLASGEAIGKKLQSTRLSFPLIAEALACAEIGMDDARRFLNGVSVGCGYGTAAAISQALSSAGYVGKRKGAGGRKVASKAEKALSYVKGLKMTPSEMAKFKALVSAL